MNTTNTNLDETNKALAKAMQMKQELDHYVRAAKKRYEDTQAKFIADIQTNPVRAITWDAEGIVKEQAQHEIWMWVEGVCDRNGGPQQGLPKVLEEVEYRIRSFFGSNSTSVFSNAVERAKAEAYVQLAEQLQSLMKHFGI